LSERLSVNSPATLTLHALTYESKDEHEQWGVLYAGLRACRARFVHQLGAAVPGGLGQKVRVYSLGKWVFKFD
jgi:hypothetical protein